MCTRVNLCAIRILGYGLLVLVVSTAAPVLAQTGLGTTGNIRLLNPYPDPIDSYFAFRTVVGDYNGDGIDDLAVAELSRATRLRILLGSKWTIGSFVLFPFSSSTIAVPTFTNAVASGDFNGDGVDELAIGNRQGFDTVAEGGSVFILQRSPSGTWSVQQEIYQGLGTYAGIDEEGDEFGFDVATGDFDNDGRDDLAIGIRREDTDDAPFVDNAGAVQVVYGSASGLNGSGDRVFTPRSTGFDSGEDTVGDFGDALAAGDFDSDGDTDLAVGAPRSRCAGVSAVGAVAVLDGTAWGLTNTGAKFFRPGLGGMFGSCTESDNFGGSLAAGSLSGLGYEGLVIGASLTDVGAVSGAGAVHLVFGGTTGLQVANNRVITLADLPGGVPELNGQFGVSVKVGRLRSGRSSIAVSSPQQTVAGVEDAGAAWIIHSSSLLGAINPATAQLWTASSALRIGPPQAGDSFASALAIGDFNDDGANDLAVGVPNREIGGNANAGVLQLIFQSEFLFKDGFDD